MSDEMVSAASRAAAGARKRLLVAGPVGDLERRHVHHHHVCRLAETVSGEKSSGACSFVALVRSCLLVRRLVPRTHDSKLRLCVVI